MLLLRGCGFCAGAAEPGDLPGGEYESLREKMSDPARRPDFCGAWDERAARSGASVVGARNFLIAVNFNLNTKDAGLATEVAMDDLCPFDPQRKVIEYMLG